MNRTRMRYFQEEDILHIAVAEGPESASVELSPNITAELNEKGELIGIEIVNASNYLRDALMDSVQAKGLHLSESPAS